MVSDWVSCEAADLAVEYAFNGKASQLSDESRYWYGRLKTLCEENNTELLFVVMPYQMPIGATEEATMEDMKLYNATEDWCEENGVGYLNLFRELDGMHFDFSTDMQDVSHVNILGAEKVTKAVGEYISGNYDITDGRSDRSINEDWDEFFTIYLEEKNAAIAACGGTWE